jgi:hypothetical protein
VANRMDQCAKSSRSLTAAAALTEAAATAAAAARQQLSRLGGVQPTTSKVSGHRILHVKHEELYVRGAAVQQW